MNHAFSKIGIIVILVALVVGGILAWQYLQAPKEEIKFTYNIEECVEERGLLSSEKLIIHSEEHQISIGGFYDSYCNMKPEDTLYMTHEKKENEIIFKIVVDPKGEPVARCICPFGVSGKIENLTPGKYQVKIVAENKYVNQTEVVQTEEIEVK